MYRITENIASALLTLFLLITAFYIPYYNASFYNEQFKHNGAYDTLGKENTTRIHNDLKTYLDHDYFNYNRTHLIQSFTPREQAHLQDVKFLIDILCITYYILLATLITTTAFLDKESLLHVLYHAGITVIAIVAAVAVMAVLDFTTFWNAFHHVAFPQGNWRFPPDSTLITLYPASFFHAFTLRFAAWSALLGGITTAAGILIERYAIDE